jgi:hypothetical protein
VHTQWSRMMVRTCTSVPNSSLSHSVSTRSKPRAPASASSTGSAEPSIQAGGSMPAMAQKVGARSTSPTGALTTEGAGELEGAGRHTSGRRMSASTWYGPLNRSPKSPCNSPWSVVNTTSRSSPHPRPSMCPRTRPRASSMSSHSTAFRALTSRTWSGVRVAGTHSAGAS